MYERDDIHEAQPGEPWWDWEDWEEDELDVEVELEDEIPPSSRPE